jgi:hypothetical protein
MRTKHTIPLLLASAIISFGVFHSAVGDTAIRTVSGQGCRRSDDFYACSIPVGTDFSTANLETAYIDYRTQASAYIEIRFEKRSYTGSYYDDFGAFTSTGQVDQSITAKVTKLSPSGWDYIDVLVIGEVNSRPTLTGVSITGS